MVSLFDDSGEEALQRAVFRDDGNDCDTHVCKDVRMPYFFVCAVTCMLIIVCVHAFFS